MAGQKVKPVYVYYIMRPNRKYLCGKEIIVDMDFYWSREIKKARKFDKNTAERYKAWLEGIFEGEQFAIREEKVYVKK